MKTWSEVTKPFIDSEKGISLRKFIAERRKETNVYPAAEHVMRPFKNETLLPSSVRIVMVGNEPYSNNTTDGYAFSSTAKERSDTLEIIFKELHRSLYSYMKEDTWKAFMPSNQLNNWVKQGVLLMNRVITVEEGKPGSHENMGWEDFTADVIARLGAANQRPRVFMLWGKAESFKPLVKGNLHLVLTAPYPDYSGKGFIGCDHFLQAHEFMQDHYVEGENHLLKVDMRQFVEFEKIIDYIKNKIIESKIPLARPNDRLKEIGRILRDDYFWDLPYGINYSTKI
jgi:uracil-DNA glycosylase